MFNTQHVRQMTNLKNFGDVFERALQLSGCQSHVGGEVMTLAHDRPQESTDDPNSARGPYIVQEGQKHIQYPGDL